MTKISLGFGAVGLHGLYRMYQLKMILILIMAMENGHLYFMF